MDFSDPSPTEMLTREIFGNVSPLSKSLFYAGSLVALGVFAWGVMRRARLWRRGRPAATPVHRSEAAANLLRFVVWQARMRRGGWASAAHALLFGGFLVLFIGTVLIAVEHVLALALGRPSAEPVFHRGAYYAIYELVLDVAGVAFLAGCALFAARRWRRTSAVDHDLRDWIVLALFTSIGITGFLVEGLRIVAAQTPQPGFSCVGWLFACGFERLGLTPATAPGWHIAGWWLHAALALALVAWFPYCRLLHAIAGAVRLSSGVERLGTLSLVSIAQVEETGQIGASRLEQFSRRQLVELDACVSCGRCERACPAFEAGKPLSPRAVVQDIRRQLVASESPLLPGDVVQTEAIWSCTTCSACVDVCPLGVRPLDFITDMRRHLIADGQLRGAPALALARTTRSGNPWGLSPQDRMAWADGLDVPTAAQNPGFDVLYWVGCAAAYDARLQRVARSVVKLLRSANVNFAVLGNEERCTGEACRRMGDELLFQELAGRNIEAFERHGINNRRKRVVSHCPHCVNSLKSDYPQLGACLDVVHHSAFLDELVASGRLEVLPQDTPPNGVTYHDPCYLARVHGVAQAPRTLVELAAGRASLTEMPRHGRDTACCGAGGGRMWFDDPPETRAGRGRIDEALATGAETLAVACPFCLIMTTDGLAARGGTMAVRDVAEVLAEALPPSP
jgi:Fe-S oxidoreductase/nitrate reductase gamma subunit